MTVVGQVFDHIIRIDTSADIPASGLIPGQIYVDTAGNEYQADSSTTYVTRGSGGGGTVTSVAASGPSGIASWSGSPVTTSGTLTQTLDNQSKNTVLAGPASGSSTTPAFRSLTDADDPEALWLPTTPGTPYAWWKADAGVYSDAGVTPAVNNDPVYQWNDQSGNGNHLIQTSSSKRPLYKTNIQNGMPGILFDGADDCLTRASFGLGTFTIGWLTNLSGTAGILTEQGPQADANDGFALYGSADSVGIVRKSGTRCSRLWVTNWATVAATWKVSILQYDTTGTFNGLQFLFTDSWQLMSAGSFGNGDPGTSTVTDTLNVGSRNNGASVPSTGYFVEGAVWTPALSYRDCRMFGRYLSRRWAVLGS